MKGKTMKQKHVELIHEVRMMCQYVLLPCGAAYIMVPEIREFVNTSIGQMKNFAKKSVNKIKKQVARN